MDPTPNERKESMMSCEYERSKVRVQKTLWGVPQIVSNAVSLLSGTHGMTCYEDFIVSKGQ